MKSTQTEPSSMDNVHVKSIKQVDERTLGIMWTNDVTNTWDVVELRRKCPCAVCIDEWTHERKLNPKSIAETIRPIRVNSVGQYALSIQFSDGHQTGIYTFKMLRGLARH